MKALFIVTGRGLGGDAMTALNAMKALERRGVHCDIALDESAYGTLFEDNGYEWHRISVYNEGLVKLVEKAVHKGSKLYVEGTIRSRKYTSQQDGTERTAVEIALQGFDHTIKLLDPRPNTDANHTSNNGEQKQQSYNGEVVDIEENNNENVVDDDIPF